jgi:hypothetical protein
MKISGLEFAYNYLGKRIHIDAAQKDTQWWLLEDKSIELVLCDGEKVKKYWRTKSDGDFLRIYPDGVKQYWNRESNEHKYIKQKLLETKGLRFNDNCVIRAHSVGQEVWFDNIRKRPDIVFYDEQGEIMCLIEIFFSNKKTPADIRKLSELNVPVFEINISNYKIPYGNNKGRNKPRVNIIFDPARGDEYYALKERISEVREGIKEKERIYRPQYWEIIEAERKIEFVGKSTRKLNGQYKWLEEEIQSGEIQRLVGLGDEIRKENRQKSQIVGGIQFLTKRIRDIKSSTEYAEYERDLERELMMAERWASKPEDK